MNMEELSSMIEETVEMLNEMDRAVSRKFPQKEQMEYFNSLFDINSVPRGNIEGGELSNFFENPITQVMTKKEDYQNNNRLGDENEITYDVIKVNNTNIILNEESLMNNMEEFHKEFEKRRNNNVQMNDNMMEEYFGLMTTNDMRDDRNINWSDMTPEKISKMREDSLNE